MTKRRSFARPLPHLSYRNAKKERSNRLTTDNKEKKEEKKIPQERASKEKSA